VERLAQLSSPVALAVGLLSAAAAVALAVRGPISGLDLALTVTAVAFVSTTLVGMAVLRTSPGNLVGWILLVAGAVMPLSVFGQVISDATYVFGRPAIPGLVAVNLIVGFASVFGIPLVALFGLLLFPDGRLAAAGTLPRRRTRWLARTCWVMMAGLIAYSLLSPSLLNTTADPAPANPIGVPPGAIGLVFVLAIGPVSAMTWAHLFGRARAAGTPDQRRALTLAAAAGACVPVAFLTCLATGLAGGDTAQIGVIENAGAVAIAAASWFGIIRYGLPAAVEVAAYRIAVEAMTNASRHAPGATIEVSLSVNGRLELLVADAGAGLPPGFQAGVGLRSMRERASELGGECVLDPREPHGTVVRASLPLEAVPS
jgi:hypothetical protein